MLGLYHGLKQLGKKCQMISGDPIPDSLSWAGISEILVEVDDVEFDTIVVLDCEPDRTGTVAPMLARAKVLMNIDHHQKNPGHGQYSYIDTDEAATAVMVYNVLEELGCTITPEIAQALYGGIVGDTGGFRHANTTQKVLSIAAKLVGLGANPNKTAREIFDTKPWQFVKLLGHTLTNMQRSEDGKILWMALDSKDFAAFDADPTESDQLIQYGRMVEGTEVVVLFREVEPGEVRIGFRSHRLN